MSTLKDRAAELAEPPEVVALRRAQALLATPERWCQGHGRKGKARCVGAAILDEGSALDHETYCTVWTRVQFALGPGIFISEWNDAPGRTHAEVLALLDRAIAGEGPQP